jgi:hypothetical protein
MAYLVRDLPKDRPRPDRRAQRNQGTRRPVITRRVRSGQSSRWRSDSMRPLSTYSLLWWSPGRICLVRDLPKDRCWRCWCGLWCSISICVCPVVRGAFLTIPAVIHPPRCSVLDLFDTLRPSNDDDKESVVRTDINNDLLMLLRGRQMAAVLGGRWSLG